MFLFLPPTPSADFFIIGFADATCQETSQDHSRDVNDGGRQDCHAYFGSVVKDEVHHQSVTTLEVSEDKWKHFGIITDFLLLCAWMPIRR